MEGFVDLHAASQQCLGDLAPGAPVPATRGLGYPNSLKPLFPELVEGDSRGHIGLRVWGNKPSDPGMLALWRRSLALLRRHR